MFVCCMIIYVNKYNVLLLLLSIGILSINYENVANTLYVKSLLIIVIFGMTATSLLNHYHVSFG